jgi:two-component system, chemotaxis family, protein-glutamate methylesterase/glutaminase
VAAARKTRILIVDDSAVIRSLLRSVISRDARLEVAATAADGASALACLETNRPDLILLDVEMPVMNGLVTLRELRARGHRMPVIMCSALTQRGAQVTIEALAGGASDYVAKPQSHSSREEAIGALAADLIPKIHALAGARPRSVFAAAPRSAVPLALPPAGPASVRVARTGPIVSAPAVIVIGVSTGGPAALDALLPEFPPTFPLPILIVQHMPDLFTRLLADRLNSRCPLRVAEAEEGMPATAGTIAIARGNWHLEVIPSPASAAFPTLHLSQGPQENHCRPAADVLFRSAARGFGAGALAVVLTGMGSDGLNGCRAIRAQGGYVLAQDEASSTVWGMPGAVANAGLANRILPLDALAAEILKIAGREPAVGEAREYRKMVV